jgi:hypothetical protein
MPGNFRKVGEIRFQFFSLAVSMGYFRPASRQRANS